MTQVFFYKAIKKASRKAIKVIKNDLETAKLLRRNDPNRYYRRLVEDRVSILKRHLWFMDLPIHTQGRLLRQSPWSRIDSLDSIILYDMSNIERRFKITNKHENH